MFIKTWKTEVRRRQSEGSFTLIETVIALAIVAFLIVEVAAVQGNSIVFSDYGRNITQASWLARRVMSQVEYYWKSKPFTELETNITDGRFEDNEEYTYTLEIKEWKFPFLQLLQSTLGGGPAAGGDEGGGDDKPAEPAAGGMGQMVETIVKQVFGSEPIFMTAHVEVSWAEGAARNSTGITYMLTNQAKLDESILPLKPVWDRLTKPPTPKKEEKKPGTTPPGPGDGTNPPVPPPAPPPADGDGGTDG